MVLKAFFSKWDLKKVTGPRGGEKWVSACTMVEDTLHPVTVSFGGITKTLYTRGDDAGKERQRLYEATGELATGVWQHGLYGSIMHKEAIELWKGRICSLSSYASGQIKDQHKYLKSI